MAVDNWKHWYSDLSMIGRHYLVYSASDVLVKRQYTICNSIVPEVYWLLLDICDTKLQHRDLKFNPGVFSDKNRNSIYLTCKDYQSKKGVATRLHNLKTKNEA